MTLLRKGQTEHRCSWCKKVKPIEEFYLSKGAIQGYCKPCWPKYERVRRAGWTKEQWDKHYALLQDWKARNPERVREHQKTTLRNRQAKKPPPPPHANVYKIPQGDCKGRLQVNWYDPKGKRHRTLALKGASRAQAEEMLQAFQGPAYAKYLQECLEFVKNGNRRSTDG